MGGDKIVLLDGAGANGGGAATNGLLSMIPGMFVSHNFFFDMNIAHESKSNKTPLYLIGELIGVPNTVMDSALHELKDRIDKDPKYKDVKNWLESLPKI